LVPFAAIGKSNCQPRHERQTKSFLLFSKSSITIGMSGKQLIFCILVMAKVTASRGINGKQITFFLLCKCKSSPNLWPERRADELL
jgi:hypothetical protein